MTDPVTEEYRQNEKNREWLKNNDLASGSGGGGGTVVSDAINGLVKDYSPPGGIDGASALVIDTSAQLWEANHEYSNNGQGAGSTFVGAYVTPSTNPNEVTFIAFENGSFVSGDSEPDFAGGSPASDGTTERPAKWTDAGLYSEWEADTEITGNIFESGSVWGSDGGGASGLTKPDFSSTEANDTVTDNEITWTNIGAAYGEWAADTRYSFRANADHLAYGQPHVVPVGAIPGVDSVWIGQGLGLFGTTGATEPEGWEEATPGDGSVWLDGDIMWAEDTSNATNASPVLTGIEAPSQPPAALSIFVPQRVRSLTRGLTLEDKVNAEGDYNASAESAEPNQLDCGESNYVIGPGRYFLFIYDAEGGWQLVTALGTSL